VNAPAPTRSEPALDRASAATRAHSTEPERKPTEPQLAVWTCAQHGDGAGTSVTLRELTRRAIAHYSDPGDLVLDPRCRTGIALEQAVLLGRRAVGLEPERRLARLARTRLDAACTPAAVLEGRLVELPRLLATSELRLVGEAAASGPSRALAGLPYELIDLVLARTAAGQAVATDAVRPTASLEAVASVCTPLLKRGGFLVLVLPQRTSRLGDLLGETVRTLEEAGLRYWQQVIALTAAVRDSALVPARQVHLAATGEAGGQAKESCHLNVLVFRRPERALLAAEAAAAEAEAIAARAA
jgi:modification methylase